MTFCTKSHLKFCIFRDPTESGTWEFHSCNFSTLHMLASLLPSVPPSLPLDVDPNETVKTQKTAPFFPFPSVPNGCQHPDRLAQNACHRREADTAPMPHAQGKSSSKTYRAGRTTKTDDQSEQSISPPAAASISPSASVPPNPLCLGALFIAVIQLAVHGLGTGAGHSIRGLISGCRAQAAPCLPTFPSFAYSPFMQVMSGLP